MIKGYQTTRYCFYPYTEKDLQKVGPPLFINPIDGYLFTQFVFPAFVMFCKSD